MMMFAGGCEATIVPIGIGGFCAMRAMSTRNDDPKTRLAAVRQGARRLRHGRRRGRAGAWKNWNTPRSAARRFIAKSSATATPPTRIISPRPRPDGEGAARCMKMALRTGGLNPDGHFLHQRPRHLHAAGRRLRNAGHQDRLRRPRAEAGRQFHQGRDRPHARRGGRGGNDRLRAGHQARHRPADDQLSSIPIPECDLDYVPNTAREMPVNAIVNNSFGFGGHNSTIAAKKFVRLKLTDAHGRSAQDHLSRASKARSSRWTRATGEPDLGYVKLKGGDFVNVVLDWRQPLTPTTHGEMFCLGSTRPATPAGTIRSKASAVGLVTIARGRYPSNRAALAAETLPSWRRLLAAG